MASTSARTIAQLEKATDSAVVVVMNHWPHHERAFDMNAEAARVAVQVLERRARRGKSYDTLTIFAAGRGGHPAFAESIIRVGRALWPTVHVIVPYFSSGFVTQLALRADAVHLHPYAALGALDDGNVARLGGGVDADIVETLHLVPVDAEHRVDIAHTLRWRSLARAAYDVPELFHAHLGRESGLTVDRLQELGLPAADVDPETATLAWKLYGHFEDELELRQRPAPRYIESEIADEVEFAPAIGLHGAVVESVRDSHRFVMDTGRPDPDTGVYHGDWQEYA